jgi:GAF domain
MTGADEPARPRAAESAGGFQLSTELDRIADQLKALARVQDGLHQLYETVLGRDVDLNVLLRQIVATAMDLVDARYGALAVLDEDGEHVVRFIPVGLSEREKADLAGVPLPQGRGLLGYLMTQLEPLRVDDIGAHPASVGFPPGHPPMRTLLGVAISSRSRTYGRLYVSERHDGRDFDAHDEAVIVALAGAAGLAIDDARLFSQVRAEAEHFQRLLLPRLPDLRPFQAAALYLPAPTPGHIGGDWYDALLLPDGTCTAVIGDVGGTACTVPRRWHRSARCCAPSCTTGSPRPAPSSPSSTVRFRRSPTPPSRRPASPASNPPARNGRCAGAPPATRRRCWSFPAGEPGI